MLNATREDIAKENYGILTDTSGKYSKRYRTIGEDGKS